MNRRGCVPPAAGVDFIGSFGSVGVGGGGARLVSRSRPLGWARPIAVCLAIGSGGSCGCDPCSRARGTQAEGGEAGEVGGGDEQVEVGAHLRRAAHSGASCAVAATHEVTEFAFDFRSRRPVVGYEGGSDHEGRREEVWRAPATMFKRAADRRIAATAESEVGLNRVLREPSTRAGVDLRFLGAAFAFAGEEAVDT